MNSNPIERVLLHYVPNVLVSATLLLEYDVLLQKNVSFMSLAASVVRVPGYRSRGLGFDSQHYQMFWEIVSPQQGSLSLASTTEELLSRKYSSSGLDNRKYGRKDPLYRPRNTLFAQKVTLTSPKSGAIIIIIIIIIIMPLLSCFVALRYISIGRAFANCENVFESIILNMFFFLSCSHPQTILTVVIKYPQSY
jgi:hypothetical protein